MWTRGGPGLRDTGPADSKDRDGPENQGSKGCEKQLNHRIAGTLTSELSARGKNAKRHGAEKKNLHTDRHLECHPMKQEACSTTSG